MAANANDARTRKRLLMAQKVAPVRMKDAPKMVALDDLMQMFPTFDDGTEMKRGTMNNIVLDIQTAFATVADNLGMTGITSSIEKRNAKKTAG
jgi:hypothetical protein